MNDRDRNFLCDEKIPESVRVALAQSYAYRTPAPADDSNQNIWSAPLVAALAGLITLSATFVFDRLTASDAVQNTITVEQLKSEIAASEIRLQDQLETRARITVAEIEAQAQEREFQYKIVAAQIEDGSISNLQRAEVLWFLARTGVLTTLNTEELEKMVIAQRADPEAEIFPVVNPALGSHSNTRIPYDTVKAHAQAPWQVGLWNDAFDGHYCGGVLVEPGWVLTVANCFGRDDQGEYVHDPKDVRVVIGTTNLRVGGERLEIAEVVIHPEYDWTNHRNNIALLRLATPSRRGTPAALPNPGMPVPGGTVLRVSGWGTDSPMDDSDTSLQMKAIDVPVVSNTRCNAPQSYDGKVSDDMLCAGLAEGGADVCQGFSGSAAMLETPDGSKAIGLVSWGHGCGVPDKFGVYTRVASFTDWIVETIARN